MQAVGSKKTGHIHQFRKMDGSIYLFMSQMVLFHSATECLIRMPNFKLLIFKGTL